MQETDSFAEARNRAAEVLRQDAWLSVKATAWAAVFGTGGVAAIASYLVSNGALSKSLYGWVVFGAALLSCPVVFGAMELRRLYERSVALRDLVAAIRQYEILVQDARQERDQERLRAASLEQRLGLLTAILRQPSLRQAPADAEERD